MIKDFAYVSSRITTSRMIGTTETVPSIFLTVKRTSVESITPKEGRAGPLVFVTLSHEISQSALCVRERQDLVYRQKFDPKATVPEAPKAPSGATIRQTRKFTTTELFRYSALTHNGHRIHYDRDYARQVEGYGGIVVHGPLLAQHLMLIAEETLGRLTKFSFRATSPLMDFEAASFEAMPSDDGLTMWVAGPDGRQCMQATASAQ
jgi:3-methylfumaryl-CoA hydratase